MVSKLVLPKEKLFKEHTHRRWHVQYDLAYDGGGSKWTGYYRTKIVAYIAIYWNYYFASWGGSAVLVDTWEDK